MYVCAYVAAILFTLSQPPCIVYRFFIHIYMSYDYIYYSYTISHCVCICVQGSDSGFPSQLEVTVLTCQSPSLVRAAMDSAAELVNMDHLTRIQVVCINRKHGLLDHVMAEEGVCVCVCVCARACVCVCV